MKKINEILEKNMNIIYILLSLACTFGLSIGNTLVNRSLISTPIESIIYFSLFYIIIKKSFRKYNTRSLIISIAFGLIFALSLTFGGTFCKNKCFNLHNLVSYINISTLTLIFSCTINLILNKFDILANYVKSKNINKFYEKYFCGDIKSYFIIASILIVFWIPAFLALFPGYASYDGPIQYTQFENDMLTNWHPIVHTLILANIFNIGKNLFGSLSVGLTLFVSLQAITGVIILSLILNTLLKRGLPKVLILISTIFIAINPIIQIFTFATTKDTLFGIFFVFFILIIYQIISEPKSFLGKKRNIVLFIFITLFMTLMKKQGIYIFILLIPIILLLLKKNKIITFLVASVIVVSSSLFIYGPFSDFLKVEKGPVSEMLSLPLQQMARAYKIHPENITQEQKEKLFNFVPDENLKKYIAEISDPIKDNFNEKYFKENKAEFFKLYFSIGIRNFGEYINQGLYQIVGYFYPGYETTTSWSTLMEYSFNGTIPQDSKFDNYYNYLMNVGQNKYEKIPVVSSILCMGTPFWILMTAIAICIYNKKWNEMFCLVIVLIFMCTLILGPLYCIRYLYPILLCVPFMIILPFAEKKDEIC